MSWRLSGVAKVIIDTEDLLRFTIVALASPRSRFWADLMFAMQGVPDTVGRRISEV